jgi:hypothetical protein
MIRLTISRASYNAIKASLTDGWALTEPQEAVDGHIQIWLPKGMANALARLRAPGESYSDTVLRLADAEKELR